MARLNRERFPDPNVPPPGSTAVTYGEGLLVSEGSVVEVDFGTDHDQVARGDAAGAGAASPTTTQGDLIVRGASADQRLAVGSAPQYLGVSSGLPAWKSFPWSTHTTTSVQTSDATQTTCGTYTVPAGACTVKLLVTAATSDLSAACGWELIVTVANNSGTVSIFGGGAIIVGPTDGATAWSVTVDVSGTSLRLRVTGAAATTIDWTARWIVG